MRSLSMMWAALCLLHLPVGVALAEQEGAPAAPHEAPEEAPAEESPPGESAPAETPPAEAPEEGDGSGPEAEGAEPARPAPPLGALRIECPLLGVRVRVDGEPAGTTPVEEPLSLTAGPHRVEASRPGYGPARAEVDVVAGEVTPVALDLPRLEELPSRVGGRLQLMMTEPGAEVRIDGGPPWPGRVPEGPHLLEVRLDGFEPWVEEVDVVARRTTRIPVDLVPTTEHRAGYERRAHAIRLGGWITAGVGFAALATALGLYLWNDHRYDEWNAEHFALYRDFNLPVGEAPSDGELLSRVDDNNELIGSIQTVDVVSWALLGVGIAAALTSFGIFFLGPRPDRFRQVTVAPCRGGLSVAWGLL